MPDISDVVSKLHSDVGVKQSTGQLPPPSPMGGLDAALQSEMQRRLAAANAAYQAEIQDVVNETAKLRKSDLVSIRAFGEELLFAKTEEADVATLIQYLVDNGWKPLGESPS